MSENKTKHTPGPWVLDEKPGADGHLSISQFDETEMRNCGFVARVHRRGEKVTAEAHANAALIAAAPELLEALKTTLGNLKSLKHNAFRQFDTINEWINVVEAAVAKAEGQS